MTETKKQIKELKAALPGLKEKVFAVALLLAVSVLMVATVSYAWVTMSTAPELGGVQTTVAANGALEIALSDFDGEEPEDSAAGDSFSAEGQTTHGANITWGNLINLSNEYGLESLVLRPAALDLSKTSYIYSIKYSEDGRMESSFSDFGFTTWYQTDKTTDTWQFVAPSNYLDKYPEGNAFGVRAISSVKFEGNESINVQKLRILQENQAIVKNRYINNLIGNEDNQRIIQLLVNDYLAFTMDEAVYRAADSYGIGGMVSNPGELKDLKLDGDTYIPQLTAMMEYFFEDIIVPAGDTLVYIANLQSTSGTVYTLDMLVADDLNRTALLNDGVKLVALGYNTSTGKYSSANSYKTLYDTAKGDLAIMNGLWEANGSPKDTFTWGEIESVVNHLININTVTIYDVNGKGYRVGSIVSDAGGVQGTLDLVNNLLPKKPDIVRVVLTKGSLKDFEQLSGASAEFPVEVSAHKTVLVISVNYDGDGRITTNADHNNNYFRQDQALAQAALNAVDDRKMVAADTYGMVLDIWVRTNAESSMLTLNGTPEVVAREEQLTKVVAGHDAPRLLYVYSYYTGNTTTVEGITVEEMESVDVYEVECDPDGDGELAWGTYYFNSSTDALVYEKTVVESNGEKYAADTETPLSQNIAAANGTLVPKTRTVYDTVGFTSANRIWQEDDQDLPKPADGEISTTQGSGSCYIFYASDQVEYESTKTLLDHMRLVFLDADGKELSQAKLNTERIYSDSGKHIVPLEITSYKEEITEDVLDENGNVIGTNIVATGLCRLYKNEPRRITVLVYLEGEGLENNMVMSNQSVTGSLNLQFDSTADLRSVGDSELENDMISLNVTMDTTEIEYTGSTTYRELKALIEGLTPKKVEASFVRMYNATQGKRLEALPLEKDSDGYWKVAAPFLTPGTYVLNALTIDGVDYTLAQPITVSVSGFDVGLIDMNTSAVLTVDKSTTKFLSVNWTGDVVPETMVAQFVSDENKFVNVTLRQLGENWQGTGVFNSSGQYTLKYLIVDGETFELPESKQLSFMAYLGLTADVELERRITDENGNTVIGSLNYEFTGAENIHAFAKIYDDAGNLMKGLGNVVLYYKVYGSSTNESGFSAEMTWDGEEYTGKFNANRAGKFEFGALVAGTGSIESARNAPILSIISKDPPEYQGALGLSYDNGLGYFKADITNASTANIWAVVEYRTDETDTTPETMELPMTTSGTDDGYQFVYPDMDGNANNGITNSNGIWTVTELRFDNVYNGETFYEPGVRKYTIDIPDQTDTVVNYITVSTESILLGATRNEDGTVNISGAFMDSYNLRDEGLSLTVRAPIGKTDSTVYVDPAVYKDLLTGAKINLGYAGGSETYGGYTGGSFTPIEIGLSAAVDGDSVKLTIPTNDDRILSLAGKYTFSGTVSVNGYTAKTDNSNMVEIYSNKPTVTVTSITPAEGTQKRYYSVPVPANTSQIIEGSFNKIVDPYTAVVYIYYDYQSGWADQEYYRPVEPKVKLTLSGIASEFTGYTATMLFPNSDSSDYNRTFEFTATKLYDEKEIGYGTEGTTSNWGQNVSIPLWHAGKQTVNTITVTHDGATYTVQLTNPVTINQPDCPVYVDFAVDDSTFTGTVPGRIFGTPQADGTFTITLPGSQTWTAPGLSAVDGDFTLQSDNTDQVWTGSYSMFSNGYTTYNRNTKIYKAVSTTTTWTITKTITGWKIGDTVYQPGETVKITGVQQITAVISSTDGPKTTQTETATRTVVTFTKTGTSYWEPSGTKVSSATNTDTTTYS